MSGMPAGNRSSNSGMTVSSALPESSWKCPVLPAALSRQDSCLVSWRYGSYRFGDMPALVKLPRLTGPSPTADGSYTNFGGVLVSARRPPKSESTKFSPIVIFACVGGVGSNPAGAGEGALKVIVATFAVEGLML